MHGRIFFEDYSKPLMRAEKTQVANVTAWKHLRLTLGGVRLAQNTADQIEMYLRLRLRQRKRVKTAN
ncbi:MAG: hypothetical protein LAP39_15435 [Acidobacteriia bacterium]|nr:hypothetical protein [Terriglobia bacterium]